MADEPQALASKVVDAFRGLLDDGLRADIGDERFHQLHGMVREAIAEQSDAILDRLEEDLKRLRSEMVERRPLEL